MNNLLKLVEKNVVKFPNTNPKLRLLKYSKQNIVKDLFFIIQNESQGALEAQALASPSAIASSSVQTPTENMESEWWKACVMAKMGLGEVSLTEKINLYDIPDDFVPISFNIIFISKTEKRPSHFNDYDFFQLFILELRDILTEYIDINVEVEEYKFTSFFRHVVTKMEKGEFNHVFNFSMPFLYTHQVTLRDFIYKTFQENLKVKGIEQQSICLYTLDFNVISNRVPYEIIVPDFLLIWRLNETKVLEALSIDEFVVDIEVHNIVPPIISTLIQELNDSRLVLPWVYSLHKKISYNNLQELYRTSLLTKINEYEKERKRKADGESAGILLLNNENLDLLQTKINILLRMLNYKRVRDDDNIKYLVSLFYNVYRGDKGDSLIVQEILRDTNINNRFDGMSGFVLLIEWLKFALSQTFPENQLTATFITDFVEKINIYWDNEIIRYVNYSILEEMAAKDHPELYIAYKSQDDEITLLLKQTIPSHLDTARILTYLYKDVIKCVSSDLGTGIWYYFSNKEHRWKLDKRGSYLKSKIFTDLLMYYTKRSSIESNIIDRDGETDLVTLFRLKETPHIVTQVSSIKSPFSDLISKLKDFNFVDKVLKIAMGIDFFYDEHFENDLDTNDYLLGFPNGVYDLKTHIFRPGKPSDYISKKMKVPFKDYSSCPNHEKIKRIDDMYKKIYVDDDLRRYVTLFDASCLEGSNPERIGLIPYGIGRNAKTLKHSFLKYTFDEYFGDLPVQYYFETHENSGAASPHVVALKGCRIFYSDEPRMGMIFNESRFKAITGRTLLQGRNLHSNHLVKFYPNGKPIISMNTRMNFGSDPATWDRMVHIPHLSVFSVDDAPDDIQEQYRQRKFKADKRFAEAFPDLADAYVWYLLQYYKQYQAQGNLGPLPACVRESTDTHRKTHDPYFNFKKENLSYSEIPLSIPTTVEKLYEAFKAKLISEYPGSNGGNRPPTKQSFKLTIEQPGLLGPPDTCDATTNVTSWKYWYLKDKLF